MNSLLDLARRNTKGDASPRTHQASRARVLDRLHPKRSRGFKAIVAIGLLAPTGALAFAGARAAHVSRTEPALTVPVVVPTVSGQGEATAATKEDDVPSIAVTPDSATLYWDDKKIEGSPASFAPKADNRVHRVRAEAPGYATKTQLVTMDGPLQIELELQPLPVNLGPVTSSASVVDADAVVEGARESFHACFTQALESAPLLAGHATLLLTVDDTGKVEDVKLLEMSGLNAQVTTCLASTAANGMSFHVTARGTLRIPVQFRSKP